ncbi:MAG: hypothetical protein RIK87_02795 [Fuerstiella sp.]
MLLRSTFLIIWGSLLPAVVFCSSSQLTADEPSPVCEQITDPHLPNAFRLHDRVISGGQPDGAAGFRALKQLGIRTVISVDGLKPDVETARTFGLRYVHLPHGYDDVPEDRALELAKAVSSLPGPVYVHCHHGKHRSPAAAAVACIRAGLIPQESGPAILKIAGTSPKYAGLYQAVSRTQKMERSRLDSITVQFRESVKLPPAVELMTQIGQTFEHLEQIAAAGWKPPASHPDLVPAHEALMLKEHFTEFQRVPSVSQRSVQFRQLLAESQQHADRLETLLASSGKRPIVAESRDEAAAELAAVRARCSSCHQKFRD